MASNNAKARNILNQYKLLDYLYFLILINRSTNNEVVHKVSSTPNISFDTFDTQNDNFLTRVCRYFLQIIATN